MQPRRTTGGVFCCTRLDVAHALGTWNTERGTMDFTKLDGLIPAVVQDHVSGEVLMVGFMNPAAWGITRRTGYVTFYSRPRNKLWTNGETSGNRLAVREARLVCDEDIALVQAERLGDGNVCHTGDRSCFSKRAEGVTIP